MRLLLTAICALSLVGCASSPMVGWQRPGVDEKKSRMAAATEQAVSLRAALEVKAAEQVNGQVSLNNTLLGLGVLTTGLALGKAHHDAYTGTALAAGAAYLFGNQNLSKPRLSVYQSGITAVNCSLRAVMPLNIGPASERAIVDAMTQLPGATNRVSDVLGEIQATLPTSEISRIGPRIEAANALLTSAGKTTADAAEFLGRVDLAGGELSTTIDKIAEQVDKLASDTVPAAITVQQSLAGLLDISAGFAPGLKLNPLPTSATGIAPQGLAKSDPRTGILLVKLDTATAAVEIIQKPLAARLAAYASRSSGSLADCGVSDAVIALSVDVDKLVFKGKTEQTQLIAVAGGVKPYVARLRESPSDGIEIKSPLPGDSNVEVKVPKSLEKGTYTVLVMDGSNPRKTKQVTLVIDSGDGLGTRVSEGEKHSDAAVVKAAPKVTDRLQVTTEDLNKLPALGDKAKFSVGNPANVYTVIDVKSASGDSTLVGLKCTIGARTDGDLERTVRAQMLRMAASLKLLRVQPALDVQNRLKVTSDDPRCLKAAG